MRKIGQVALYVAALCAVAIAAGYVSLVLSPGLEAEPGPDAPSQPAAEDHVNREEGRRIRVPAATFIDQVYRSGSGALAGGLVFMAVHAFGFARMKGGVSQLFAEPDAEDLLPGLCIYGVAVLAGALIGGVVGRLIG